MSQIGPTRPGDRIEALDTLRGFAIFGILVVNMTVFSGSAWSEETFSGRLDQLAYQAIELFAQGKFLNLFSFLFGAGFALQMSRAARRSARFAPLYVRRLVSLFLIGLAHGVFVAWVDVLQAYALLGFLLLLTSGISQRAVLAGAGLFMLVPVAYYGAVLPLLQPVASDPFTEWQAAHAYLGYGELVGIRIEFWRWIYTSPDWYADVLGTEFVLFLLGVYVGRAHFFERIRQFAPKMRAALPWLAVTGITLTAASRQSPFESMGLSENLSAVLRDRVFLLAAISLTAAYSSALVLLSQALHRPHLLAPLSQAGRMALTNYLLQSVICALVFYESGLGLYGRMGPAHGLVLTVIIFAVQLAVSSWWMNRARFGPVEWVWRSVTYGRMQPLLDPRPA